MIKKYFAVSIIAASIAMTACSSDDDDKTTDGGTTDGGTTDGGTTDGGMLPPAATPGEGATAYDFLVGNDDFSQLLTLINGATLDGAPLADWLDDDSAVYTIFAPTNDAFTPELVAAYGDLDAAGQARVLANHVVVGAQLSSDIAAGVAAVADGDPLFSLPTLASGNPAQSLAFAADIDAGTGYIVTYAGDQTAPLATDGLDQNPAIGDGEEETGPVHAIGTVLVPQAAVVDPGTTTDGGTTDGGTTDGGTGGSPAGALQALLDAEGDAAFTSFLAGIAGNETKVTTEEADDGPWTVFASTDAGLAGATWNLQDSVIVNAALLPADLEANPSQVSNSGKTLTFGGTVATGLTLNGMPIKLINPGKTSPLYRFDGVIP